MDYEQLIKNWHTHDSSKDPFSRFVFEYLAFIAFLMKVRFIEVRTDRNAVQSLKRDGSIKKLYLNAIQDNKDLRISWEEVRNELNSIRLGNASGNGDVEEIKWWNYSGDHLDQQAQDDRNRIKGVIHDLDDWENMVGFWYAVRSNLFHGAKDPESRRDQFLVEHGHRTLRPLVEIFLKQI